MNQFKNIVSQGTWFRLVFILLVLGTYSCINDSEVNTASVTKTVAEEKNNKKFSDDKKADASFLVEAAETNLKEIELGKLALQKAVLVDVKELAKMMEKAHRKSLNSLSLLAATKSITLPSTLSDKAIKESEELSDLVGVKFDKEYSDRMVLGHKKIIETFEKASTESKDDDIRDWAIEMLPELRTHLNSAIKCQNICKKM